MRDFEDARLPGMDSQPIEHEDGPTFDWVLSLVIGFAVAAAVIFGVLVLGWLTFIATRSL